MELITKNKTIELVFTTRKIVEVSNILKGKNFEDLYFKAMNENDLDALAKIIQIFAEDKDTGLKVFNSIVEVYDFMDEYKKENEKTYQDIFEELAEAINEEGFFNKKMTKEDLISMISNPLSTVNLDKIVKKASEKVVEEMITKEMEA